MMFVPCAAHVALMDTTQFLIETGAIDKVYTEVGASYIRSFAAPLLRFVKIFDFGAHPDEDGLYDFGGELVVHGLFEPPYDATLFLWDDPLVDPAEGERRRAFALSVCLTRKGKETSLVKIEVERLVAKLRAVMPVDGHTFTLVFGGSIGKLHGRVGGFYQDAQLVVSFDSGIKWNRWQDGVARHVHGSGVKMLKAASDDQVRHDQATTNRRFLAYCGLLNTRGVSATTHSPKNGLSEKRERQGRLPWLSYSVIDVLRPRREDSGEGDRGRSSPRAHYRRGHVRRLSSGHVTTVVPCLVGSESNGLVISNYVAKGASA